MDAQRWREVERVLDAALRREPSEWPAVLDAECAGDTVLRSEVSALLGRATVANHFLKHPPAAAAAAVLDDAPDFDTTAAMEGRRIGPWRIVREIGRGGMARVFLAKRDDGAFEQTVALKLLRSSLDTEADRSRFRFERQILATLNHPNIARLLDGGVTEDGRSYLVLEYVDGQPLDRYCHSRNASLETRLALFATVAHATQYAHSNLIVHRDLKPSNIFVAADGTVKLLDFGLAKLVESGSTPGAPETRAGQIWLTPEYAAPEQIYGEPVTTLTDVYQLGVVLYELLAERLPFEQWSDSPHSLAQAVMHEDPPPPSTFQPALRGDLDAIVMTALRKEPARRYASAGALIDDIQRFRNRMPVLARRGTVAYRVRRFVSRHRAAVAAAALAVVALLGAAVRERTLRARAEAEARKAIAVEDYLIRVFDVADPFAPPDRRGENLTARAIVDRGAARIDSVLGDQPDVQAELRRVIARVYSNLGLFDRAAPMLRRQLAQRRALYGNTHPAVAETLDELGVVLQEQDEFSGAEAMLREAVAQRRALLGASDSSTAESIDHLAQLLEERDQYDQALPMFREALATRRTLFGATDVRAAESIDHLAHVLWSKGEYDEAEPLYRQALAIREQRLGPDHPLTSQTVHNLAQVQQMRGKTDDAEALFRRALASKRKSLGNAHPSVTVNLNNLANLLRQQGRLVEAESLTREALALDRKIFGERHGYVAASLDNLATILRLKGDFGEAMQMYQQALDINLALYGAEHRSVALNLANLGAVAQVSGDYAKAIPLLRQAREQYAHLMGVRHSNYAIVSTNLARALRESGQLAEAEEIFRGVLATMDSTKAAERGSFFQSQVGLGQILVSQRRLAEARPMLEGALAAMRKQYGDTSWRTLEPRLALGRCLMAQGDRAAAEPLLREAAALGEKVERTQPYLARQSHGEVVRLR
ncbi:MAG TPA: serine/threonine-protein kinase [Gemmatimonadaceae bacterium]|nr:serine/threonine-protein kinase [Gemmatimonadaceae bacterium]